MNDFNLLLALLGGGILLMGLISKWLSASPFPPTLIALFIGMAVGPEGLDWLDLGTLGDQSSLLDHAARLALGIGLVGVALRIPSDFPRRRWRSIAVLVGVGMPVMWGISTLLIYWMLDLPLWLSALIGAAVTPTDPVASTSIMTGQVATENIPGRIRHLVSFDSGANDGLAYLFIFIPFLLFTEPTQEAIFLWLTKTLLWEVGAALVLGLFLGFAGGVLLKKCENLGAIEPEWRLVYTAALGLLAIGAGKLIHSDELLVVFAAAVTFDQVVSADDRNHEELGQEAVNRFFSIPIFVLLGAAIPWQGWEDLGWPGIAMTLAILLLRRPLTILLLRPFLPEIRNLPDTLFAGWFGPIAVAAIYYAALMHEKLQEPQIWNVVSLVICLSVVLHGLSAAPLTRFYGKVTGYREEIKKKRKEEEARQDK